MTRSISRVHGATLVEATLVLPIIIGLIVMVMSLGFAISQNALFTDSVRAAGRAAVAALGDCDTKKQHAEQVLRTQLESQGLSYHTISVEAASMGDEADDIGFNKRGLKVRVRGKLAGLFDLQYSSFSAFEGENEC